MVENKVPKDEAFKISNVSIFFVHDQLHNLKCNKASRIDEISVKYLKISAPFIAQFLAVVRNLSIQNGEYPDALKQAKGMHVFKKGEKSNVNNYRPNHI